MNKLSSIFLASSIFFTQLNAGIKINRDIVQKKVYELLKWPNARAQALKWIENFAKLDNEIIYNLDELIKIFSNIDWGLIWWLGIKESKFEINAKSNKNAKWIFQMTDYVFNWLKKILYSTNKYKWKEEAFFDSLRKNQKFMEIYNKMPREALAVAYLSFLLKKYNWDRQKALGFYNSWKDNFNDWWKETINYVIWQASVVNYWKVFKQALKKYLNK